MDVIRFYKICLWTLFNLLKPVYGLKIFSTPAPRISYFIRTSVKLSGEIGLTFVAQGIMLYNLYYMYVSWLLR